MLVFHGSKLAFQGCIHIGFPDCILVIKIWILLFQSGILVEGQVRKDSIIWKKLSCSFN
jgi:hypothetical protein